MTDINEAIGFLGKILPKYIAEEISDGELLIAKIGTKKYVYNYSKIPAINAIEAVGIFEELNTNLKAVPTTVRELRKKMDIESRQRAFELLLSEKSTEDKKVSYTPVLNAESDVYSTDFLKNVTVIELDKLEAAKSDFFYKRGIISSHLSKLADKFMAGKSLEQLISEIKEVATSLAPNA